VQEAMFGFIMEFLIKTDKEAHAKSVILWNSVCIILKLYYRSFLCNDKNSVAFSPQANYTDRATAACRRS
jgi:hypothetical protein